MDRLTIEGLFCDIAQCRNSDCHGASLQNEACDSKRVYERLRAYENIGLSPEEAADVAAREENVQEACDRMEANVATLEAKWAAMKAAMA